MLTRVDKDFADKVLDKDLMLDKRGGDMNDSNRLMSKESDDEDASNISNNAADKEGKKEDEESDDEQQLESNISKALSDKITKVVVVLVLTMLILLPILETSQFLGTQLTHDNSILLLVK